MADGYDSATLTIDEPSPSAACDCDRTSRMPPACTMSRATDHGWQAQIRAGVTPAIVAVRVAISGKAAGAIVRLLTNLDTSGFRRRRHAGFPPPGRSGRPAMPSAAGSPSWPRRSTFSRGAPAGGDRGLRGADPLRLSRSPARARRQLGHGRASAGLAGHPIRREISVSVHAAGGGPVPREARRIPGRRPHDRGLRAVRRRQDAAASQHAFRLARCGSRPARRPALLPAGERPHAVPQHDLSGPEPDSERRGRATWSTIPAPMRTIPARSAAPRSTNCGIFRSPTGVRCRTIPVSLASTGGTF